MNMKFLALPLNDLELLVATHMVRRVADIDQCMPSATVMRRETDEDLLKVAAWYNATPRIVGNYLSIGANEEMLKYFASELTDSDIDDKLSDLATKDTSLELLVATAAYLAARLVYRRN